MPKVCHNSYQTKWFPDVNNSELLPPHLVATEKKKNCALCFALIKHIEEDEKCYCFICAIAFISKTEKENIKFTYSYDGF